MGTMVNQGPALAIVAAVALSITTPPVLLRCYVRLVLQRRFAAGDYLILFSQASFCAFMYCVLHAVKYGIGRHVLDILVEDPNDLPKALKARLLIFVNSYLY